MTVSFPYTVSFLLNWCFWMLVFKGRLAAFSPWVVCLAEQIFTIVLFFFFSLELRRAKLFKKCLRKGFFLVFFLCKCAPVPIPFLQDMFGSVSSIGSFVICQWP